METKKELKQKEVKILKCVKCGKEYVFDTLSQKCPECEGTLKKGTVVR
jgi:Zn finger protein HypA/HybF involved in hydrogenase expression